MSSELEALTLLLGDDELARALHEAPGGWRDLSAAEITFVVDASEQRQRLLALQRLARPHRILDPQQVTTPAMVAAIYADKLGDLVTERMVAVALDGRRHVLAEVEVARGGRHGMVLTAADVLRPMIRAGAAAFILTHNHPSGSAEPSQADVEMTTVLEAAADIVGVPLLDHVVVAGRGGGWCSMLELGLLNTKENDERTQHTTPGQRAAESQ